MGLLAGRVCGSAPASGVEIPRLLSPLCSAATSDLRLLQLLHGILDDLVLRGGGRSEAPPRRAAISGGFVSGFPDDATKLALAMPRLAAMPVNILVMRMTAPREVASTSADHPAQ